MELSAIGMTLGSARIPGDESVYVGSVKTNIGHAEGAAGVASLIKVVLCLEKGMLVPNAGFERLNPKIRLDDWRVQLCNRAMAWPTNLPQRASINSFGFGGSNAHAVIESAAENLESLIGPPSPDARLVPQVMVFSTFDKAGIDRVIRKWSDFLETSSTGTRQSSVRDVAHTLLTRRSHLGFRSFAVVVSLDHLKQSLDRGLPRFSRSSGNIPPNSAFFFTGQGGQWAGMGEEMLCIPAFARSLERTQDILLNLGCRWNVLHEMHAEEGRSHINEPDRSQALCCALQIALVDLLASWGIQPSAVVGHSSGEIGTYTAHYFLELIKRLKNVCSNHRSCLCSRVSLPRRRSPSCVSAGHCLFAGSPE